MPDRNPLARALQRSFESQVSISFHLPRKRHSLRRDGYILAISNSTENIREENEGSSRLPHPSRISGLYRIAGPRETYLEAHTSTLYRRRLHFCILILSVTERTCSTVWTGVADLDPPDSRFRTVYCHSQINVRFLLAWRDIYILTGVDNKGMDTEVSRLIYRYRSGFLSKHSV